MSLGDPGRKLRELHDSAERISANLVELEIDSSRQLLEASTLAGESAAQWAAASEALTELWRRRGLLDDLLERADKVRISRRADELRTLLEGSSIELARADVPLAERRLLGSLEVAERCSVDELLGDMSAAFDQVKTVVSRIGTAWETVTPKLDTARRLLAECGGLSEALGEPGRREFDVALRKLEAMDASVATDPLSIEASDVDGLVRELGLLRDELEDNAALKRGFETRILDARELLQRMRATVAEALAAREELLVKISAPAASAVPDEYEEAESELNEIRELAHRGAWQEARRALEGWTTRTEELLRDAQRARDASRAPIEARNQLRALLEAYQVKAKRLGRVEDRELAQLFDHAQDTLYNAPTDLGLAAQLVRSYQQALADSAGTPKATP
jgi:cellobiose-specific phosphotransferase system component IIA